MDWLWITLGIILLTIGFIGCIIPALPGPPISYGGLLLLHFTSRYQFESNFLLMWAFIVIAVTIADNFIPVYGTKKLGGSKRGVWGSTIGLILGLFFFPPIGLIIGPFIGAVVGELSAGKDNATALKSGLGSLLGFLTGTVLKLAVSGIITWHFITTII